MSDERVGFPVEFLRQVRRRRVHICTAFELQPAGASQWATTDLTLRRLRRYVYRYCNSGVRVETWIRQMSVTPEVDLSPNSALR
eukprot:6059095-Prymnesium_polylepis.1